MKRDDYIIGRARNNVAFSQVGNMEELQCIAWRC